MEAGAHGGRPKEWRHCLAFAQGLLYEFTRKGEVNWAEYAFRSVSWFGASKGVKPVFLEFPPTATIDMATGLLVDITGVPHVEVIQGKDVLQLKPLPPCPKSSKAGSKPIIRRTKAVVTIDELAKLGCRKWKLKCR
jgi:hypothetical protein